jgi:hypothetical protein
MAERERARIEAEAVAEMNLTHATVLLGGQALVIKEDEEGNHCLTSFRALSDWLACDPLRVPVANEKTGCVQTKRRDRALTWKMHPARRNVTKMNFAPGKDLGPRVYNTWKGWQITPLADNGAAAERILNHIREVWCNNNADLLHWVLSWVAQMIQEPCSKPGTAIVLRGEEGVGKGIIAGVLMRRFIGNAFVQIAQPGQVTGKFNSAWVNKLAVFCDESFWAGDKSLDGVIKSLCTEPKLAVEYKGKDVFEVDHHARIFFAGNGDWIVPAGPQSRRFCVLDCSPKYRKNAVYFAKLTQCVLGDGARSFFAYLQNYDIEGVNLRDPYPTEALLSQRLLSMDSVTAWWHGRLWAGELYGEHDDYSVEWPTQITAARLYGSYQAHCKRKGIRHLASEEQVARKLREFAHVDIVRTRNGGTRERVYVLSSGIPGDTGDTLSGLRGRFEKHMGGPLQWERVRDADIPADVTARPVDARPDEIAERNARLERDRKLREQAAENARAEREKKAKSEPESYEDSCEDIPF